MSTGETDTGEKRRGGRPHTAPAGPYASFARRLRESIHGSPYGTVRAFADALRDAPGADELAGDSYRTVLGYANGTALPTTAWIARAAEMLGVPRAWLAWEDGARTLTQPGEGERERMAAAAAAELPGFAQLAPWMMDAVAATVARSLGSVPLASRPEQAGRAVGKALSACVRAFGLRPSSLDAEQLAGIVSAALPLLGAVAAEAARRQQ